MPAADHQQAHQPLRVAAVDLDPAMAGRHLLDTADGTSIAFELAPDNAPKREVVGETSSGSAWRAPR